MQKVKRSSEYNFGCKRKDEISHAELISRSRTALTASRKLLSRTISGALSKDERRRRSDLICQTIVKNSNSDELSELVVILMRMHLARMTTQTLQEKYEEALEIRRLHPLVFTEAVSAKKFPIKLLWVGAIEEREESRIPADLMAAVWHLMRGRKVAA